MRGYVSSMLVVRRYLSAAEVEARWAALWVAGKHAGYGKAPAWAWADRGPTWAEVEIPHALYAADWNNTAGVAPGAELSADNRTRAARYAAAPGPLPPGIALFNGRKRRDGTVRAYIPDGNHRAYAAFLRGQSRAAFYMPVPDLERFQAALAPGAAQVGLGGWSSRRAPRGLGVPLALRPSIKALSAQVLAALPEEAASLVRRYQIFISPGRAQALDEYLWSPAGRAFVAAFEPVRAALRQLGSTVELWRGEPADVVRVRRAFLPWTDDPDEAAGFGRGGVLRHAQVPVGCILAVFPHGQGLEYLVVPACAGAAETTVATPRNGWVGIGPHRAHGYAEPYWLDGRPAHDAALRIFGKHGVRVVHWRPVSPTNDDYWSGFEPAPGHGSFAVVVPAAAWAAVAAELAAVGANLSARS